MAKKLIVVADDFGFSEAYNLGVVKGYKEGIVTVLSMMTNMDAAVHGMNLVRKEIPEACLVQHTNFVQGKPCSPAEQVPSLVDENGFFYRSSKWKVDSLGDGKCVGDVIVTKEDCKRETLSQMERFKELTGTYPIHFEGHSVFSPAIEEAFQEIAGEKGIHCMTTPNVETQTMYPAYELLLNGQTGMEILDRGSRVEDFLENRFGLLDSPYEINILHFHPGYLDAYLLDNTSLTLPRCRDLETLCDPRVKRWLQEHNIELTDFRAVYK